MYFVQKNIKSVRGFILRMLQNLKMAIKRNIEVKEDKHNKYYYDTERNKPFPREIKYFSLSEFESQFVYPPLNCDALNTTLTC